MTRNSLSSELEHPRITIKTDQNSIIAKLLANFFAVPTRSDRPVNDGQALRQIKLLQNLAPKHGNVTGFSQQIGV